MNKYIYISVYVCTGIYMLIYTYTAVFIARGLHYSYPTQTQGRNQNHSSCVYIQRYINTYHNIFTFLIPHKHKATIKITHHICIYKNIWIHTPKFLPCQHPTQTQGHNQNHSSCVFIQKYMNMDTEMSSLSVSHTKTKPQSELVIVCLHAKIYENIYQNVCLVRNPHTHKATIRISHYVCTQQKYVNEDVVVYTFICLCIFISCCVHTAMCVRSKTYKSI